MRERIIYQIFVRNHSEEGNFLSVENDLERIKSLGVDIVYLMPIFTIGEINRKGTYGSPYAIKDYFEISKDLGTTEEFVSLINKCHKLGMKLILDMVFNHTSPDNVLINTHKEFYYLRDGKPSNRVGEWSDIIDLNVERDDTQEYLLSVLKHYVNLGVDGFRFDVASLIPLSFFKRARKELGNNILFFAESVDGSFKEYLRSINSYCEDDENLVPTFDLLYNYNYFFKVIDFLKDGKKDSLRKVFEIINKENKEHPDIFRSNCLENHDNDRVARYCQTPLLLKNITAMFMLMRGYAFIYAGEEYAIKHKPELFEKDPVPWEEKDLSFEQFIKDMVKIKTSLGDINDQTITELGDSFVFKLSFRNKDKEYIGLFNLNENKTSLQDHYNLVGKVNLLNNQVIDSYEIEGPILFFK